MVTNWKWTRILMALILALSLAGGGLLSAGRGGNKGGGNGGGGDGGEQVPDGPGQIAVNDSGWILLINPDDSGRTPVAETDTASSKFGLHHRKPAWSPMFSDGSVKLAYPETDPESRIEFLMVVNVFPSLGDAIPVVGLERQDGIFQVDWSPAEFLEDGRESVRVCFSTWEDLLDLDLRRQVIHIVDLIYDPSAGVFEVNPDSPDPVVLDPDLGGSDYWQARFSPDGQWLALGYNDPLGNKSIWLASADGVIQEPLIDGPSAFDWYPAWSPDGTQLAFISSRDGREEIYVASFDESGGMSIARVTNSRKVNESWPTWSPDGLQIAYRSPGKGGNWLIGKVILATGEQFKLGDGDWPDWSPMDLPLLP